MFGKEWARNIYFFVSEIVAVWLLCVSVAFGQSTAFTYQGKLADNGAPASGNYDFQFKLFDAVSSGNQIGATLTFDGNAGNQPLVVVANGIFTVQLDFGACPTCFNGAARFLEIAVKVHGGGAFPAPLTPRQPVTSMPYALKSLNATTADGLSVACVNCVTSSQIASVSGSAVTGTIPVASVPAGSSNYIQNTSSQQASSNFNISGNGTANGTLSANEVNATTKYKLGGLPVFSVNGAFDNGAGTSFAASNSFIGEGAGSNTQPSSTLNNFNGKFNAFFGAGAGQQNTIAFENSFFGAQAGQSNTTGGRNAFFGALAGQANTTGLQNAFFGAAAGLHNTIGIVNSFFGDSAGLSNTTGNFNAFFGSTAGQSNTTGEGNAFFGAQAGASNTTAGANAFFGSAAGINNTTGPNNAFFGSAAGFDNTTGHDNAFFGTSAGNHNIASRNAFFGSAAGVSNTDGNANSFFGKDAGSNNTTGGGNSFFGESAGFNNTKGASNTFIGESADFDSPNTTIAGNNTLLGEVSRVKSGSNFATAIGARASVTQSNSLVLGAIDGVNGCGDLFVACDTVKVGIGTTAPGALLDVQRDQNTIPETALFTTFGADNEILSRASGGTRATPTATPNGTLLLQLGATGHNGNGFVTAPRAAIEMTAAEAWAPGAAGTLMRFNTTASGTTQILTRMTIADDGNIGIGTTAPADKLQVAGDIRVGTGTNGCVKDANSTIIAGTCSSDARLKRAITPFPHLLDKLVKLQPVHFYWRADEFKERHFGVKQSFGLIAQEVEKVLPELVSEDEQGYKAVNYSTLPLLSLQAIKELKAENDALKQLFTEQQNEIVTLKKNFAQIEVMKRVICEAMPNADLCKP